MSTNVLETLHNKQFASVVSIVCTGGRLSITWRWQGEKKKSVKVKTKKDGTAETEIQQRAHIQISNFYLSGWHHF